MASLFLKHNSTTGTVNAKQETMVNIFKRNHTTTGTSDLQSDSSTTSTQRRGRRGGVLFQDTPETPLQRVKYGPAVGKSILKVATLEESLQSCDAKPKPSLVKQASARFSELAEAIRQPFVRMESRMAMSLPTECDKIITTVPETVPHSVLEKGPGGERTGSCNDQSSLTLASMDASETHHTTPMHDDDDDNTHPSVRFSTLHIRVYDVMVDDNPSVSGQGPAIALSWTYRQDPAPQSVDDYEAARPPRTQYQDLKLSLQERLRILQASGVARSEINSYTRRVQAAKKKRQAAMDELSVHGKQYLQTLEKRENVKRTIQRWLGVRKTQSTEERTLWDNAQQPTVAQKSQ